jgi:uncharacterized RDD family membrane protein YckC
MAELAGRELAPFGRRAIALLVDFLLGLILFFPLAIGVGKLLEAAGYRDIHIELSFFENWYSITYLALWFGLNNYFGNGRTIGKRLVGIRVVSLVHERLSLWHSLERALGYGASTLEFGFGFFQYYIHPNRRTVHDRIAETIVVRERKK